MGQCNLSRLCSYEEIRLVVEGRWFRSSVCDVCAISCRMAEKLGVVPGRLVGVARPAPSCALSPCVHEITEGSEPPKW